VLLGVEEFSENPLFATDIDAENLTLTPHHAVRTTAG
jgi:hypothetical protein